MAKRLDWEKRKFDRVPKLSIKNEEEFRQKDGAARWLAKAEEWQARRERREKRQGSTLRADDPKRSTGYSKARKSVPARAG
jgi:hypothetical protein